MAVSSHRRYVSADADDLERAAGLMAIRSKDEPDTVVSSIYRGASAALRVLATHDVKTAEDFATVFRAVAFNSEREEQ